MPTDYRPTVEMTITDMVFNRAPFLVPTTVSNIKLVNSLVWEVMNELERCFQAGAVGDGTYDETRIGKEPYYTMPMRGIIADLAAVGVLLITSAQNAQGNGTTGGQVRFLSRAKAGTSEVQWDAIDIKKSGAINIGGQGLIDAYKKRAQAKALQLDPPCVIDVCDDCFNNPDVGALPFITIASCGCAN